MKNLFTVVNRTLFSLKSTVVATILVSLSLTGCGSSSSSGDSDEHTDTDIDTLGRLVAYDPDETAVKVLDLDSGEVLDSYALAGEEPRLYASPDKRYAVLTQRSDDLVSFVDSGLYTEDHGDHLHDYAEDPASLSFTLSGSKPTHFSVHDHHAVVFFDAQEGLTSSVMVLSDHSIGTGETIGELTLTNNMHGVGKLVGNQLFVTYRDPSITDTTLPAAVERYSYADTSLNFEHRYSESCPRLHGSAASDSYITFGCSDGVLAIDLSASGYPAVKLANPETLAESSRIGTLYSHAAVSEFVGVAGNQFFVIDIGNSSDPYQQLSLPAEVSRIAQGFNASGESFYILGDDGNLYSFNVESDWVASTPVKVTEAVEEGDISPVVAVSEVEDRLYILDTEGQKVLEVDSHTLASLRTIDLGFKASRLVWLGLSEDSTHDH